VDNATGEEIPELRAYLEEDVPTISLEEAKRRQRLGLRDWEPLPAGA
jgi:ethanolamine utilization protein EutP